MHTKTMVIGLLALLAFVLGVSAYVLFFGKASTERTAEQTAASYKDSTYRIQGVPVTLVNGVSEVAVAPGSASKTVTRYFGNELVKDVNGDGRDDVTFLVTQETGGTGTYFYVVTALKTDTGYEGTSAILLGDRIAPQSTESGPNNTVIVTFADRAPGESFANMPSVGKSVTLLIDPVSQDLSELIVDDATKAGWETPQGSGKIKADVFTGTLESVNTGCFADAECYVVVDGKHVTALRGWSRDTVGSVIGVAGFGDLESHIGETVEVYAHDLQDGTYTLYGSEGFYIKLTSKTSAGSASGNQGIAVGEPNPSAPGGIYDGQKQQIVRDGCAVGGCSRQFCGEADVARDMVTTCEYRASYACYQTATCERQSNGACGWTETKELTQCLSDMDQVPVEVTY